MNNFDNSLTSSLVGSNNDSLTFYFQGADPNKQALKCPSENLGKVKLLETIVRLPLHVAVARGNVAASKLLLDAGADVNILHADPADVPVIVRAVDNADLRMVKLLLKYKPRLNTPDCTDKVLIDIDPIDIIRRGVKSIFRKLGLNLQGRRHYCRLPFLHAVLLPELCRALLHSANG